MRIVIILLMIYCPTWWRFYFHQQTASFPKQAGGFDKNHRHPQIIRETHGVGFLSGLFLVRTKSSPKSDPRSLIHYSP